MTRPALPALVVCAALAAAGAVRAQPDPTAAQKEADRAAKVAKQARADLQATAAKPPARAGGKKVIKLDTLTVEGRIQKPEAFYVLPRSSLSFDELQKTESFVPKIEKSVQKDPF
ncbi:MAG TPA: hypothetical protein VFF12_09325 [Myxococcaceae bacterium]|nr:hypothetical protein [Myxococcaceae bacterium]